MNCFYFITYDISHFSKSKICFLFIKGINLVTVQKL